MSKERARRREAAQSAAAARRAAHAVAVEREARRRARRSALRSRLLPLTTGRQTGVLAQRRRARLNLVLAALLLVQVLVWIVRPDWQARVAALILSALAFPVIAAFTL